MATRATKRLRRKEQGAGGSVLRPRQQWQWRPQPTAAKAGAGNGGCSGVRQREGRQHSTKKWQQRCLKYYFKCNILIITRLRRKNQGAAVCGRGNSGNGVNSQRWQWWGQATVAEAEAAQGQTTINQKAVAIAAETVLVAAEMAKPCQWQWQWQLWQWWRQCGSHGSGEGGANMAPTVAEGAADVGGGHL